MKKILVYGSVVLLAACSANTSEESKQTVTAPAKEVANDAVIVELETVDLSAFEHHFNIDGIVEPKQEAYVAPEVQMGRVTEIFVSEGDKVKKGDVIAKLNGKLVESQLAQAQAQYDLAKTVFERTERLWLDHKIGSEIKYLEAKANATAAESGLRSAQAQFDMGVIVAPISGIIDAINVKIGSMATAQQPFAHIVNMSEMVVMADVSERYSKSLRKGDNVAVSLPDLGIESNSKIRRIGNVINPQNRSFEIEVPVSSMNGAIKPNAIAKLQVRDFYSEKALVVPSNAIQQDVEGDFVFVAQKTDGKLKAEKRYVKVARTNDANQSMVESGLAKGDQVVVKGYNLLTKGSVIRVANK